MHKRIFSLVLTLVLLSSLVLSVSGREVPDVNRPGSVSLAMTHGGNPIAGGTVTLYRVADVAEQNGDMIFVYTQDFAECTIPVTELESAALPEELAAIAAARKLPGTTQALNNQGKTSFSGLKIGLYLVVQQEAAPGYTAIKPFLVSVPRFENGRYIYDVDTAPKNIPEPEVKPTEPVPTEPKPTEPTTPGGHLPQTGQTNWPIPVMAVAGLILLAAGISLRLSGKKKEYEA